jgi:2-methylisocitrate lyase-like PEP mutase family enzyme
LKASQYQREKAEEFRSLHYAKKILVLPNAWDVPSARVFEDAGFPAIATSSAALAISVGYPDGEKIRKEELFSVVKKIAGVLSVPLSVDIESGFGASIDSLTDTIRRVIEAGAVGINIEDISDFEKKTLLPVEKQVERIRAVRTASDSLGIPLLMNARTDAYRFGTGDERARLDAAIRRERAYEAAGADCLYPIGLTDRESILTFVKAVNKPMNIMARKGTPTITELQEMGVKRLSLGPGPMYATMGLLRKIAQELKEKGTYETLLTGAITFDELNALSLPIKFAK